MSFLWPGAWFLAVLALPVIAFYLVRTRLERRRTSTLLFWDQVQPSLYNRTLWRRLRRWLSLALQLLFLALLLFAISQPLTRWQSKTPRSLILVLDASPSLNATDVKPTRWEHAVAEARAQIAQMGPFDQATIIAAEGAPRLLSPWSRNKRALHRALQNARPRSLQPLHAAQSGAAAVDDALALARNLAVSRKTEKTASIHLFTDKVWSTPPKLEGTTVHAIAPASPVNAGITLFSARRSTAVPGVYHLVVRAVATGPLQAELELRRNGALLDLQKIEFDGKTPWEKSWEGEAPGDAKFEASLRVLSGSGEAIADALADDDRAQAQLAAVQPVVFALHAPPHPFLDAALESLPLVQIERHWPPEAERPAPADGKRRLHLFYRTLPAAGFEADAVVLIDPPGSGFWGSENGIVEHPLVSGFEREHPLLRFVALDTLRLGKGRDITPAPGAECFAESFGKPLLFGRWPSHSGPVPGPGTDSRWLVFAFGLEESDLVFRTAFPILLGNIAQSLQEPPSRGDSSAALPGESQSLLVPRSPAPGEEAAQSSTPPTPPTPEPGLFSSLLRWGAFPPWWWFVAAGALWLVGEWRLYTRRITE